MELEDGVPRAELFCLRNVMIRRSEMCLELIRRVADDHVKVIRRYDLQGILDDIVDDAPLAQRLEHERASLLGQGFFPCGQDHGF